MKAEGRDHLPAFGVLGDRTASIWRVEQRKLRSAAVEEAEAVRVQRLREDARRPISVNLAETIALSHKLMRVAGVARHS